MTASAPPSTDASAAPPAVDAFILFNEQENGVAEIVDGLENHGISTFFWRRDTPFGTSWEDIEAQRMRDAKTILLFLGSAGWGPTHRRIAHDVQKQGKRLIPVLIGPPSNEALQEVDGLFTRLRYFNLQEPSLEAFEQLARVIQGGDDGMWDNNLPPVNTAEKRIATADAGVLPAQAPKADGRFDAIIDVLINGDQLARQQEVERFRALSPLHRAALAVRLREEIHGRFSPAREQPFISAIRAPGEMPLIRSWLLSALVWSDAEAVESQQVLLAHLDSAIEPDQNARFWVLAGLYQRQVSYLAQAIAQCRHDPEAQVATLASVLDLPAVPNTSEAFVQLRQQVTSPEATVAWPVLRALRVVAVPALAEAVCQQFATVEEASFLGYDALYALASPAMATVAAPLLLGMFALPLDEVVRRVVGYTRGANTPAVRSFARFLTFFDPAGVDRALADLQGDPNAGPGAQMLQRFLRDERRPAAQPAAYLPGYQADTVDAANDQLGIQEDVQTLTAVLLARDIQPPLAIGRFGDWGAGKSFFMHSMRRVTRQLTDHARAMPTSPFCAEVVSIEFNAWHYVDTNLWASLVSFILEQLDAYVSPAPTEGEVLAATGAELQVANVAVAEAEQEKHRVETQITQRRQELAQLQHERAAKQVQLTDLRWRDFQQELLPSETRRALDEGAKQLGIAQATASVEQLQQATAEAFTLGAQLRGLLQAIISFRSFWWLLGLLVVVLVVIPGGLYLLRTHLPVNDLFAWGAARVAHFVAVLTAFTGILQAATKKIGTYVRLLAETKHRAEQFLTQKNQQPTADETNLQQQIDQLATREQTAVAGLTAAAAQVVALEKRLRALHERRSLAHFLTERSHSDDYQKHLGLISTIRRDFEHLATRLKTGTGPEAPGRPVERIVLYIDDLDRCPTPKVVEVLQAIHLLLAHELFVVVVGVDPRWLRHSLQQNFTSFQPAEGSSTDAEDWQTTPQNYLEKIFQIPFSLRPMAPGGYRQLMQSLLPPTPVTPPPPVPAAPAATPPGSTPSPSPAVAPVIEAPAPDMEPAASVPHAPLPQEPVVPEKAPEPSEPAILMPATALTIRGWESQFAGDLFALIPTPRAAKRFTNIYRLLKAQVRAERLAQFEGSAAQPGDFQLAMLLLALLIGCPGEAGDMFLYLQQEATVRDDLGAAWQKMPTPKGNHPILACAQAVVAKPHFPHASAVYLEWLPRVARFSFELGRIIQPRSASADVSTPHP